MGKMNTVQMIPVGIESETYEELQDVARKEGKGVGEVIADSLKKRIDSSKKKTNESSAPAERKLLCEG